MGYAKPNQDAGGIHLRQFSRAIIVEDRLSNRIMYVNLDNGMISQLLRTQLMRRISQHFGEDVFNENNVMLSATHTHSCPGGFFQYMLYNIPSAGYIGQTLEALVDGVERSILRAWQNMQLGNIYLTKGELADASINRSPTSYANNPSQERAKYKHDTDKDMALLRFVDLQGRPLAMMNWFPVHGTSMNNSNHLISSDNKGYAALLMEEEFNPAGTLPGKGKFVAIFAQANEGDVSPNTRGPRCVDTGLPCDLASSTCGNPPRNEKCIAFGPGRDMFESTQIIAYKQYYKARQLFLDAATNGQRLRGPVRYVHEYIDITKQQVPLYESIVELAKRSTPATGAPSSARQQRQHFLQPVRLSKRQQTIQQQQQQQQRQVDPATSGTSVSIPLNATYRTCVAGLGYSFAAGTTDGPGAFDFQQGDTASGRYWNMVRDLLRRPSEEQIKCHHPKPILLSTGEMDFPYTWHPKVVPTQILMIGQLAIVGLPGEFTTMAGRRVREAVTEALSDNQARARVDFSSYLNDFQHPEEEEHDLDDDEHDDSTNTPLAPGDAARPEASNNGTRSQQDRASSLAQLSRYDRLKMSAGRQQRRRQLPPVEVILSGLSNIYTSYVTTVEEYEMQRYEGASTLYGPHTLQAYVNQFKRLASFMVPGRGNMAPDSSLQPPDLSKSLFTLKPGVFYDGAPHGKKFGDVLVDVDRNKVYRCREQVSVAFVAGNPRNDLKQEQSFLFVDKFDGAAKAWTPVASDASWETKFIWERTNTLFGESTATIKWDIPDHCQTGVYRIRHLGAHKSLLQTVGQYSGKTAPFKVSGEPAQQIPATSPSPPSPSSPSSSSSSSSANELQTSSFTESRLEALQQLAEQVDALQSSLASIDSDAKNVQASNQLLPASPKSDRHYGSVFSAPFRFLGSLARTMGIV